MAGRMVLAAAALAAAVPVLGQSHVVFRDGTAESLFKTSRNAVGGEGAVSGIESLVLRGRATVADQDGGPAEREVEVRILLPDGILRVDSAEGFEKRAGFYQNTLLTATRTGDTREAPPASLRAPMMKAERARLGRTMLGIAAVPIRPGWLTVRSVRSAVTTTEPLAGAASLIGEREGQRVLEASAGEGFFIRMFFDGATLPSRIQYEPGKGTQVVTVFSDRRRVSGLLLPYRITTSAGSRVVDDFVVREIIVNPRLTSADFER